MGNNGGRDASPRYARDFNPAGFHDQIADGQNMALRIDDYAASAALFPEKLGRARTRRYLGMDRHHGREDFPGDGRLSGRLRAEHWAQETNKEQQQRR